MKKSPVNEIDAILIVDVALFRSSTGEVTGALQSGMHSNTRSKLPGRQPGVKTLTCHRCRFAPIRSPNVFISLVPSEFCFHWVIGAHSLHRTGSSIS
jgi:hypothetical protein